MMQLTKDDLKTLDKFIDDHIASQLLLKRPREIALMELLKVFEDYVRLGARGNRNIIKLGQDGMAFAVQWIYKYCTPLENNVNYNSSDTTYKEAHELLISAKEYSMVWDFLVMAHRERATAVREGDTITITPVNQVTPQQDVADQFISSPDSPEMKSAQALGKYREEILSRTKKITYLSKVNSKIKYSFTDNDFNDLKLYITTALEPLWELDRNWSLGDYTVDQLRICWVTLVSLVLINYSACLFSGVVGGALDSTVLIKKKERFIRELSHLSELEETIVQKIIEDLTFNPSLYNDGRKKPDPSYQPIFSFPDDILVVSCSLTNNSNAERNIWDLLSIVRPTIHDQLSIKKEEVWLEALKKKLEGYGLKVIPRIQFKIEGHQSDIDLLIYDSKNSFILGTEMKWLTSPDRITDVYYCDQELQKGMSQAQLAKRWLDTKPEKLLPLLGISKGHLKTVAVETVVLSKNTIGSGWLSETVPIVNERLLDWILGDPHKKDIKTMWVVGKEKRYLPVLGKHFEEPDVEANFAGIKFISKKFGNKPLHVWEAKDIDMKNL